MTKEKIFIIAGEDSGDLHGANLISTIKKINPSAHFYGIGGNRMQKEGLHITEHIRNLNIIGFFEVIRHYRRIKKIFDDTLLEIKKIKPDKIILIDYPGFNLRMAKKLSAQDFDITYFILPQVWAWKESRKKILRNCCDRLISIIPFEKIWFKNRGIDVHYAGHPISSISNKKYDKEKFRHKHSIPDENKIIALLPGSRKGEIQRHWKIFSDTIDKISSVKKNITFILIEGQNVNIDSPSNIIKIKANQYEAIYSADAAIVCSGTATLETAMLKCPMIVCYKLSAPTWFLAKLMSKVKYLSLVNLISGKKIVPEFLQKDMSSKNLSREILSLIDDPKKKRAQQDHYVKLIKKLNVKDSAYLSAAKYIYD